jgi:protein-disulfide isomerase
MAAAEDNRRTRLLRMGAGLAFLAIVAVAVLIVIDGSGGGSGGDTHVEGKRAVNGLLRGIPQYGLILGDPEARVELLEFGDLQCPLCRHYAEDILPPIIEGPVRKGQVKLAFLNFVILGPQSAAAGAAALAAGEESHGWNYLELFYRNQGEEESGYANEEFLTAIAKASGVKHFDFWRRRRELVTPEVEATTRDAHRRGFTGTPTFTINGPGTEGFETLGTPETTSALEEEIRDAE